METVEWTARCLSLIFILIVWLNYSTTSIPMLRAVPATTRNAASGEFAFKSFDFILMMSKICLRVTLPTLSLFGVLEPAVMPAAFFNRIDAGGDLVMNVNDLS